jgi:hypothetical protein
MEVEQPESRMPSHATRHPDDRRARDEAIVEALMVPFSVVVGDSGRRAVVTGHRLLPGWRVIAHQRLGGLHHHYALERAA